MTTEEYFGDWIDVLDSKLLMIYRNWIMQLWLDNRSFEPEPSKIFKAFRLCKKSDCKVVIIGQDPYPQHGVSTGLAFGNNLKPDENPSPSLRVLENSIQSLYPSVKNPIFDYSLETWAKQGILLLNSALTVHTGIPGSHQRYWGRFIESFVSRFSESNPNIFWILFGKSAELLESQIKCKNGNVVKEYHPAYYARTQTDMSNKIWIRMLDYVRQHYGTTLKLFGEKQENT